jgi:hypothetical protein
MKYSLCIAALVMCATKVVAFPSRMFDIGLSEEENVNSPEWQRPLRQEQKRRSALELPPSMQPHNISRLPEPMHLSPQDPMI